MKHLILIGALVAFLSGCDHEKRIAALEKKSEELKQSAERSAAAIDFDLSSKCADRGGAWARANFPPDKETVTLNNTNHYSKAKNKCFVPIEWHYYIDKKAGAWGNTMSLWDVNENSQVADFGQDHFLRPETHDGPVVCQTGSVPCRTIDDFNRYVRGFMSD